MAIATPEVYAEMLENAKATIELRKSGGLSHLVWSFRPAHHERPTTVYATMQAIGLVDAIPATVVG
ncbi:MAG: hypothetical protein ACFNLE_06610, partial [Rothia aeria]